MSPLVERASGRILRWYQPWLALAATSLIVNGAWEWLALSYYGAPGGAAPAHGSRAACLLATVGDAGITIASYAAASVIGTRQWLRQPAAAAISVYLGLGVLITIALEYVNVYVVHRWTYAPRMPVLAGIGVLPVVQWLVLPLFVLWSARRYLAGAARNVPLQESL